MPEVCSQEMKGKNMSKTTNRVELQGFAGKDAEQKSDKAPIKFSIATGGGKYPTDWHSIIAWPDSCPEAIDIRKGDQVRVIGRLSYNEWTAKDGTKRNRAEISAYVITINPESKPAPQAPRNAPGVEHDIPF
jgi:single-stranded DNA-binding protein